MLGIHDWLQTATVPTFGFLARPGLFLPEPPDEYDGPDPSTFDWREDPLFGLYDVTNPPRETFETGTGDCDDYTRLVAAWLYHQTDRPVTVHAGYYTDRRTGHMVVSDGTRIYSYDGTPRIDWDTYATDRGYDIRFTRTVSVP